MPTMLLRTVGMSYLIEGIATTGLDAERLRDAMAERYDAAMAVMSTPRSLEIADTDGPSPIDAVILDRRAEDREALMAWIAAYIETLGYSYREWAADGLDGSTATLHFHS